MSNQEDLLVGIVNNIKDLEIIRDQHWYRIPVINANKLLSKYLATKMDCLLSIRNDKE